jgi:hypothetical protein
MMCTHWAFLHERPASSAPLLGFAALSANLQEQPNDAICSILGFAALSTNLQGHSGTKKPGAYAPGRFRYNVNQWWWWSSRPRSCPRS